jgi:hypothetical protein
MKQIKNITLAVLSGLLILSVATVSCKKKSSGGASVSISSVAPNPAISGTAVTITGTGFTSPATVTVNGGAAITGTVSGGGTIITFTAPAATTGIVAVTTNGKTVPFGTVLVVNAAPVGPTSDSVASTNLIAHWTFDGSAAESISHTTPETGGTYNVGTVSYATSGVIGNCATFTNGALVYPIIPNLDIDTALESYTISMWVKLGSRDGSHWQSLFQLNSNAFTDLFGIVGIQVLNQNSGDTLPLQIDNTQADNTGFHTGGFGCGGCFNTGTQIELTNPLVYEAVNPWTLLTVTYDGNGNTRQELTVFANGVAVDSLTMINVTKPATFRVRPTGNATPTSPVPSSWDNFVTIGTFNWSDFGIFSLTDGYGNTSATAASRSGYMSNGITGSLDDIRVFNTPLTRAEVDTLYVRGQRGL